MEHGEGEREANSSKIGEHGRRVDNIVRSMLEHSRQRPEDRSLTDINDLVGEYAALAFQSADPAGLPDVRMVYDYGADVGQAELAPSEIGRVVVTLVNNAIYEVGAYATSSAPAGYTPTVRVETRRDGGEAVIRVVDNGPGVPSDLAARVFQPFFTTKPTGQGAGLGLSLSHEIVTRGHGGTLRLVPTEAGAAFEVRLPAA